MRRRPYRGHGAKTIRPQLRVSLPHLEAKAKENPKPFNPGGVPILLT
jgi:hypothetical protein